MGDSFYKIARQIFFSFAIGEKKEIPNPGGKKVRDALYMVIKRNKDVAKLFKTKMTKEKTIIWRKM